MIPYENYLQAAAFIKEKVNIIPNTALVLGSGLGGLTDSMDNPRAIAYSDIPNFPVATNKQHAGKLFYGKYNNREILVFSGRCHFYEGYSMEQTTFYVRMLQLLGVKNLIITNAAGSVNESFSVGDIMLITDHIKLVPQSPLTGVKPKFGDRFVDMTCAYTKKLQDTARKAAAECEIDLKQGVYMFFAGPQYETPAEVRAARILGADAVGMSTVPEVITASSAGIKVLGLSLLTNMAAGITGDPLSDDEVVSQSKLSSDKFGSLVLKILNEI